MKERIENIKKNLAGLSIEEAIEKLEEMIFIEKMADFMDFGYVADCKAIIKELKDEQGKTV